MNILLLNDCSHTSYELMIALIQETDHNPIYPFLPYVELGKYGTYQFYRNFTKSILSLMNRPKYDVILVSYLGIFSKLAYISNKPYMLYCRGGIRDKDLTEYEQIIKGADYIFYSTPDLKQYLPKRSIWLKRPIGEQFTNFGVYRDIKKACRDFTGIKGYSETPYDDSFYKIKNIPYELMPSLLNRIEVFYDKKNLPFLSRTALEALSCGCKVVDFEGKIHTTIPEKYKPNRDVLYRILKVLERVYL